ncbi:hypothetical protein PR003_g11387 [Phytophthora rubi]|uniref:MULE transposase domain-containing protein n=1 Tax=Phytophthora rubi TaxID=129364 RepID=A0A6A3MKH5_9STRA|nr:hypothetical protein PR001_g10834 [Phytophthora rubi]KAE9338676.1 hypothetical protein PR003_g11387 [Phytophthora rubi]
MRARYESGPRILHVDATFKLNQLGYPVIVVGVSDCARSFLLVALFVSSQRSEPHHMEMFAALNRIHGQVLDKAFIFQDVMGYADGVQLNGIRRGLDGDEDVRYLRCFYHVVAKGFDKMRALLPSLANTLIAGVHDMHFSLSDDNFVKTKENVLAAWSDILELTAFSAYFQSQWLTGRFTRW